MTAARGCLVGVALFLLAVTPAAASYDGSQGGTASPSALSAGGATDYSVSLTGRDAVVDVVLVLDNSGSMADSFGGPTKWNSLASASKAYVDALNSSGLFTRGGRVGVVRFSAGATTGTAPTTDVAAIKSAIDAGAPATTSCISCGIQRATELLTALSGAAAHRQIVYVVADGANDGTTPTMADAVAASNAAHIERRVIGLGSGAMSNGLETADSNGTVPYPTSPSALAQAYSADPTAYGGATNLAWTFHVAPGFTPTSGTASTGTVSVAGQDVTWTVPSLGATTATFGFHAIHDPAFGCAQTALLTGTTFSDAEGDATPAAGLGPVVVSGCPAPPGPGPTQPPPPTSGTSPADPTRSPDGIAALTSAFGGSVVELPAPNFGMGSLFYGPAEVKSGKLTVPAKGGTVRVFGVLCDGCQVTVVPTLVLPGPTSKRVVAGRAKTRKVRLKTVKLTLKAGEPGVLKVKLTKAQAKLVKKPGHAKLSLTTTVTRAAGGRSKRTTTLRLVVTRRRS